ncbi:aromatic amino acid ammonia-lyase [Streptomyces sp. NBC_00989]|uniref:aromatic amino acid ammonia-lyase n=1 Tax=Streptomyces sp. NBC_00989 TaxID=2903705 RepID=UPI0038650074|nr:aromatic amino acid lyase [Streptomyces sp. NBC_00989]
MSSQIADTPDAMVSGNSDLVVLDGVGFGVADVVRLADGDARPVPGTDAMKRATESWDAARQIAATGRVYGRSTGVGANRNEDVPTEAAAEHGLRLLRSHAGAIGDELPAREVRAMLAVRANQLLAGGAGLRPTVVTALCEALEHGVYPVVNEFGSVGTGDIAALAQVGLALVGEHPWRGVDGVGGAPGGVVFGGRDAEGRGEPGTASSGGRGAGTSGGLGAEGSGDGDSRGFGEPGAEGLDGRDAMESGGRDAGGSGGSGAGGPGARGHGSRDAAVVGGRGAEISGSRSAGTSGGRGAGDRGTGGSAGRDAGTAGGPDAAGPGSRGALPSSARARNGVPEYALTGVPEPHALAGVPEPQPLDNNDALALISSNALTLGQSALALHELRGLIGATQVVGALSLLAVDGSHEPYAAPVHAARPHRGSTEVARRMRELIGAADRPTPPLGRIQDPYGFRCLPQIHGPAHDAADALEAVLAIEINAAAENPFISAEDMTAYHHGGFYQAQLVLALDHFRLALTQVARLSTSRLSSLNEPAFTRLKPFLADNEAASSGVMILEYAAAAALGDLRAFSAPASLGHAVLSRGVEEQASFASLAARQTLRACRAYRLVVGCELVAAVRALRQRDLRPDPELPVGRALELAESVLDDETADRPLTDDVTAAAGLLDRFTEIWRGSTS